MNKKKVTLLIGALLTLVSCRYDVIFLKFDEAPQLKSGEVFDYATHSRSETYTKSYYDVLRSNPNKKFKERSLISKGEQNILVLPVLFPDYALTNFDESGGKNSITHLQNAFFGAPKQTSWHSVASYYYASSYGQLLLTGEVAPWFTLPENYKTTDLNARVSRSGDKVKETSDIVNLAVANYVSNGGDLQNFDQDEDGYIDSVYVVYGYPYLENADNNIFWAFAAYYQSGDGTVVDPVANMYAWSSYDYLMVGRNQKPNSHTFIHEVGHLLGLVDYYNTNYDEGYSPLGGFDMMDNTVGDHTAFSKMLLEWVYPTHIKQAGSYTLRPFATTGDLFVVKNNWNESALDEYLLFEYYTPEALNEQDSRINGQFKLPRSAGLKLYHVDARTVYKLNNGQSYVYTNINEELVNTQELLAHSNTFGSKNKAPIRDYKLYALLERNESTNIKEGGSANRNSLFRVGDGFGVNYYQDFVFNDETALHLNFVIDNLDENGLTISFSDK